MDSLTPRDIAEMTDHWGLSLKYLSEVSMDHLPEEHAIRLLTRWDFPRLLREVTRLRPELNNTKAAVVDNSV